MAIFGVEEAKVFFKHFAAFLAFALLGWIVSWLNLSLTGVMFICALYSWKVTHEKSKKQKTLRTQNFFNNEKNAIQELFEEIPRWVYFPDVERVEWLNKVAAKIWPDVTYYVMKFLKGTLEPKIQSSLPSKINSFTFDSIDFGEMPPRVTGVKVYTEHTNKDEVIIDVDVFYAGNAAVSIKISKFEAGVKDLQFKGTLRIVLKPLLKHPPFLGGIQIYFLTKPMLNFDLTDIASVLEVPGLYDMLNRVILTQISNFLVLPNMLSFSFSSAVDVKQLRYTEPKGVLMVKLLAAKNLTGHDVTSKSDPYAKMSVSTEVFRTATVKNNHNPIWEDEVHYFTVLETDGIKLELRMYDDDETSRDDRIGEVPVSLSSIVRAGSVKTWKNLSDGEGSVYFMCTWYGLSSSVSDKLTAEARHSLSYNKPVPAAVLSVYVDSAKDLLTTCGSEKEPCSHVRLSLANEQKITGNILNTPNPIYQENFHFLVKNVNITFLKVEFCLHNCKFPPPEVAAELFEFPPCNFSPLRKVCDAKSDDDVYGSVSIPLSRCAAANEMTLDQPFLLTGGAGTSEINIRLSLKNLILPTKKVPMTTAMPTIDLTTPAPDSVVQSPGVDGGADETVIVPEKEKTLQQSAPPSNNNTLSKGGMELKNRKQNRLNTTTLGGANKRRKSSLVGTGAGEVGAIELTVEFKRSACKLVVIVHRCRELMKAVDTDEPPSVYVKLQISDKSDKEKTDTAKESFYPVFNETFEFDVEPYELSAKTLELKVKNYESFMSKVEIGAYSLALANINISIPETKWYPLHKPDEKD